MPFNSPEFLLLFLPVTCACVYLVTLLLNARYAVAILIAASFIFYASSSVVYLMLFIVLMIFNYACGRRIASARELRTRRLLLALGCTTNVAILIYFKYRGFVAANL